MEEWLEFLRLGAAEVAAAAAAKNYCEIPLRNKQKEVVGWAKCSPEDYEELMKYKWYKDDKGYAKSSINTKVTPMHRLVFQRHNILTLTSLMKIDHIDCDKLNNTFTNLRVATSKQNSMNRNKKINATSQYRGVFKTKSGSFSAEARINNKGVKIGSFKTEIEAAMAYDVWCVHAPDYNEGFRKLNFSDKYEEYKTKVVTKKLHIKHSSIYHGVYKTSARGNFRALCNVNNVRTLLLRSTDEIACAKSYDKFIYDQKLDRPLNFPLDYPDHQSRLVKVQPIKTKMFVVDESTVCLTLKRNPNNLQLLIDAEDYEKVKYHNIALNSNGYVSIYYETTPKLLHRILLNIEDSTVFIDHIDGNRTNNKKSNLRTTNSEENSRNKKKQKRAGSTFYGVYMNNQKRLNYRASVSSKTFRTSRNFDNEIFAARYRDLSILKHFPDSTYKMNFVWTEADIQEWKTKLNFQ